MTIISIIAVWAGMSTAVVAMYFFLHALIADVYVISDIAKRVYWFIKNENLCDLPDYEDAQP